jgi:hypothetical protein
MNADNIPASPVKLPKAVQMQADKANAHIKQSMEARLKETSDTPVAASELNPTTAQSTPAPTPEVQPTPVAAPVEVPKTAEYWEHRFKTSEGMFKAESNRLKAELIKKDSHIGSLEARLTELENKVKTAERQAPRTIDLKKYLSQEEIDTYGPDALQATIKAASAAAEEASDRRVQEELERQLKPLKQKVELSEQEAATLKQNHFWKELNRQVPDWATINGDEKFHEWLSAVDTISGYRRQDLLTSAEMSFDSERVVALFSAYKQNSPAPITARAVTQVKVVPDPVTPPMVAGPTDVEFVKRSDISLFYRDKALGRYKHRQSEADAFEKKIEAAKRSGRII